MGELTAHAGPTHESTILRSQGGFHASVEPAPTGAAISGTGTIAGSAPSLVRRGGRPEQVVNFEAEVVRFFIESAEILGLPKSLAAIYGICFSSQEPLSFADIAARLDLSQGSISQGLRILREVGALKIVLTGASNASDAPFRRCATRRDYYVPDFGLRKLAGQFLEERLEKLLKSGRDRLQAMQVALPDKQGPAAAELRLRLELLQSWHNKGCALVPLVKACLQFG